MQPNSWRQQTSAERLRLTPGPESGGYVPLTTTGGAARWRPESFAA